MASDPGVLRALCTLGLSLVLLGGGPSALAAEPSAADKETARALMEQGHGAYDAGHYPEALAPFERAHAIMQLPTTGLWLARTREKLGSWVEARDLALAVARLPVVAREPDAFAKARRDAETLAAELGPRIPTLEVRIGGVPEGTEVNVFIDGAAVHRASVGVPRKVNPGLRVVTAEAPGFTPGRVEVRVAEGRAEVAQLTLSAATDRAAGAEAPDAGGAPTLAYVGFVVGAAGLAAGAVTGSLALSRASDARDFCTGNRCAARAVDDIETSNTFADVSTVSFGVGAAGAVFGALVWALDDGEPATEVSAAPLEAAVGLGTFHLRGSF